MERFFDVVFSSIALFMLLPLLIPTAIILRFSGQGEVFFLQERIGKGGEVFKLFKFATMLKNSPNLGTGTVTIKEDPRVLPVGKYLRKAKINELPQDLQASVFDMYINSGSNAIKILQKAAGLPKNKQDGSVGPETLAAIASANVSKEEYADARIAFYKDLVKRKPKTKKYLNGWITRANKYR